MAEYSREQVRRAVGRGAGHLAEQLFRGTPAGYEAGLAGFLQRYSVEQFSRVKLYPGAVKLLEQLQQDGVHCAVLTNKPEQSARQLIEHLGLARFFEAVLGQTPDRPLKPHPAGIELLSRQWDCSPEALVLIGDSRVDIETARNAGVRVFFHTSGMGEAEGWAPDGEFSSYSELSAARFWKKV